jgi:hypothetical protein
MKFETVYKITTADCKSIITGFDRVPDDVKVAAGVSYSTQSWTLPNPIFEGRGELFVFKDLNKLRTFWLSSYSAKGFMIWEAVAFGVHPKKSICKMGSRVTIEKMKSFWNTLLGYKSVANKGFYVAEGVKLVKALKIPGLNAPIESTYPDAAASVADASIPEVQPTVNISASAVEGSGYSNVPVVTTTEDQVQTPATAVIEPEKETPLPPQPGNVS